jgi:hypothetical protein
LVWLSAAGVGLDHVVDRPADHGHRATLEAGVQIGQRAHAGLDMRDLARHAGGRQAVAAALVGQVDDRVLEARQHVARQFAARPALEQQGVAASVKGQDRGAEGRVGGHEGRHFEHQVGARLGAQQILQQGFAGDVERDPAAGLGPDLGHGGQQRRRIDRHVRAHRENRQARGADGAVAVDHRRVAEDDLRQDQVFIDRHVSTHPSAPTWRIRNKMKAMDSARGQGANHSDTRRYREDLQRRHRVEDALSCFEFSGLAY